MMVVLLLLLLLWMIHSVDDGGDYGDGVSNGVHRMWSLVSHDMDGGDDYCYVVMIVVMMMRVRTCGSTFE